MTSSFPSFIFSPSLQRTGSTEAGVKVTKPNKPPFGPTRASLHRAAKAEAAKRAAEPILRFSEKLPKKAGLKSSSVKKIAAPKKIALERDARPKLPARKAAGGCDLDLVRSEVMAKDVYEKDDVDQGETILCQFLILLFRNQRMAKSVESTQAEQEIKVVLLSAVYP